MLVLFYTAVMQQGSDGFSFYLYLKYCIAIILQEGVKISSTIIVLRFRNLKKSLVLKLDIHVTKLNTKLWLKLQARDNFYCDFFIL